MPFRNSFKIFTAAIALAAIATIFLTGAAFGKNDAGAEGASYSNPSVTGIKAKLHDAAISRGIPPGILYGIAYQESGWRQFDAGGHPLISFDGGIGVMQITSYGSYDVERLKVDIDYNIAATFGARGSRQTR